MKKKIVFQIAALIILMGLCCLFGWRIMPRIWPTIKSEIVYSIIPSLKPEIKPVDSTVISEMPQMQPYVPSSNATMTDDIYKSDSVIYYFYKPNCPYCDDLEPLIKGLPDKVSFYDGTESTVKLIAVNKNDENEGKLISDYYDRKEIPENERYVPAIVIGEEYLFPGNEIIDELLTLLLEGEGCKTALLDGSERIE